ncbi:MAG TPA: hypothetical protein VEA69_12885 [Tepidisphaeraceae bacterium]|nr:hypothetical protein [Tepidisphaeraceae bacterium]
MLDDESPKAPHIVAASIQLDLILQRCKLVTAEATPKRRQFLIESVRPAFAALRWLNAERFDGSSKVASAIAELEARADDLAALPTNEPGDAGATGRFPACQGGLSEPEKYDPRRHCPTCLDLVMGAYGRLEKGFGTWAI